MTSKPRSHPVAASITATELLKRTSRSRRRTSVAESKGFSTPSTAQRAAQQHEARQRQRRGRQADDPALARPRLGAQHLLDEALAARHLVEALLIGGDAAHLVVGERSAGNARGALPGVEGGDLRPKAHGVAQRAVIDRAVAGAEKGRRPQAA